MAVDAPALPIRGRIDTRVPHVETARTAAEMMQRHRPAALVEREDQRLAKSATRPRMRAATVALPKARLPTEPPSASAGC